MVFEANTVRCEGSSPEDLSVPESGPLSNSRWLTTVNRVLRLYLGIENPIDEHKILVSFDLKSHMPVCFHIKKTTDYIKRIHWNTVTLSTPPLPRRFTNQEVWSKVQSGGTAAEWNFDKFPCHNTQAVERCVKLVTEASQKVVGSNSRDGFMKTTLLSRPSMPKFSSKSYFKVPKETEGK
ncbi:hypothetical protein AVEN_145133-1 [Araneus ventricosus]|uniref:Uncharacterized protein n=1 Tax=Araneus ventricosus TaxID=182803 RepID=A0A4Y2GQ98_ARAVE|nr:hypothetical protein AVEN_145133-1 [Araneus ventricosus]